MPSEPDASTDRVRLSADRERDADSGIDADADIDASHGVSSATPLNLDADSDTAPLEWGPVRFERLRSLAFGAGVTAGGLVLAALLFLGVGVGASLLGGGSPFGGGGPPSSMWALLVILFVGGPMSLLYWLVAYDQTSPERRQELLSQFGDYSFAPSGFRIGWTLAGAGVVLAGVAAVGLGSFSTVPSLLSGFTPLLVSLFFFLPTVAGSRGTDLRLDPAAGTIERTYRSHDRTRTDDLGAVIRTRRVDLPWTTLFLLAYRGNAWYRSTPWLFVPSDRADEVESAIDGVLAESDGPDRASVPERLTLATLGSFSVVVGLLVAVATGEGAGGLALTLLSAPFSLLFLALAARL